MTTDATALRQQAARKRAEADAICASADLGDTAATRLSGANLRAATKHTDSRLRRHREALDAATDLEHRARLADARERDAARVKLTREDITGARAVRDTHGLWHEVVRVNATTVTVKTPHSWTDRLPFAKIVQVAA